MSLCGNYACKHNGEKQFCLILVFIQRMTFIWDGRNPQSVTGSYSQETWHRENVPTWLSGPRFHAPLHNFTTKPGDVTHRWTRWQHQMHFRVTLLIMVVEIRFNFQIGEQCAEKAISKITFNIRWNLKQIWCSWYTWVSKGDIKGFENNGV